MRQLDKIKKSIESAGFSHVKVELEAQLWRDSGDPEECSTCNGEGNLSCDNCSGEGFLTILDALGNEHHQECAVCEGREWASCSDCNGTGTEPGYYDFDDERVCHRYLKENVSVEAKNALTFSHFYNDGSVDSELTFTMPVAKMEYIAEFIVAFKKLAEANGHGFDVDGAGMHLTVIPASSKGVYPVSERMPADKVANFTSEVTKLLPALFFAASCDNRSRRLRYRNPQIGPDKYNAVSTHRGTCYEFRVFETCYDRPEAVFEYFETIGKTLAYHKNPKKKVSKIGKRYEFVDGTGIERFVDTPEKLEVLRKQSTLVKPTGKTFRAMCLERGVDSTKKAIDSKWNKRIRELRVAYKEEIKAYQNKLKNVQEDSYYKRSIREAMEYRGFTKEQAIKYIIGEPKTEKQFIDENLRSGNAVVTLGV